MTLLTDQRAVLRLLQTDDRLARAAWSRLAEPAEPKVTALVEQHGAGPALEVVAHSGHKDHSAFVARMVALDPRPCLEVLHRLGGRLLCPGDDEWPPGLLDLDHPPLCLWVRGPLHLATACERSVAIVGSRASTPYGAHMSGLLADGVAQRGFTVVSGAAYGIDLRAHTAALALERPTIAVLAGGIDRPYPREHEELLAEIAAVGLVMSENPPGSAHMRHRFIHRNRMIATMTLGTVVVEAALRSGALNTARTAAAYHRPVGAVPGPATSKVSEGCHQALREGFAVAVTSGAEVAELVGSIGVDVAPRPTGEVRSGWDDLEETSRRVLDALPTSRGSAVAKLSTVAGLAVEDVRSALGQLSLLDLARRDDFGWRRVPPPKPVSPPPR